MSNWLTLKLNRRLNRQGPGIIRVKNGTDGQPIERYWRDRLKDAETDKCCEIVKSAPAKKTKETTETKGLADA